MTPALVSLLMLIASLSVTIFVARRVPSALAAYPLAIVAGGATFVALFLLFTFTLSFAILNGMPTFPITE
ncbi:hypothetical protein FHY55_09180 [Oceanicola sp. D3]|uniref:hypothetical protein n=1 Tax=Oceanicola sp. D3 TaxID=2587163 RepID=UPI001121BDBF|nr:hypothetical protein [Oceanicola sp. D3]QDC09407.1 hypothetical protein FHY55_09180 [Oceanicola sp. D3]